MTIRTRPWTYRAILNRLTGVSTPIVGFRWTPTTDERTAVHRFFAQVGDRRLIGRSRFYVLPAHLSETVSSVLAIQEAVTVALIEIGPESRANVLLEDIRAACHDFRDYLYDASGTFPERPTAVVGEVTDALQHLRFRIGANLSLLADAYQLPISGQIAAAIQIYKEAET